MDSKSKVGLTLTLLASGFIYYLDDGQRHRSTFIITGLLAGAAIATKPTAGVFWLAMLLVLLLFPSAISRTRRMTDVLRHMIVVLVISLPWYFRNWILTGNPVYPFATSIVGNTGPWTVSEIDGQIQNYTLGHPGGLLLSVSSWFEIARNNFGAEGLLHPMSSYLFLGLILALFSASFWSIRTHRLVLIILVFTVFVAYDSYFLRYLFPTVPILSVLAGLGFTWAIEAISRIISISADWFSTTVDRNYVRSLLTVVTVTIVASPGVDFSVKNLHDNGIVVNPSHFSSFLSSRLPSYLAFEYLNEHYGSNYKVYAVHQENMRFYCQGQMLGDWFGPDSFARFLGGTTINDGNIKEVHQEMLDQHINFLLISNPDLNASQSISNAMFKVIYRDTGFSVVAPL